MSQAHEWTELECATLNAISQKCGPYFQDGVNTFCRECGDAGIEPRVAGASLAVLLITNLTQILCVSSGMPVEDISRRAIMDITLTIQAALAKEVDKLIRAHNAQTYSSRN